MITMNTSYWEDYYRDSLPHYAPSQFAALILSVFTKRSIFVDIGCGDGRDAIFFGQYGKQVFAIDQSAEAIQRASLAASGLRGGKISFQQINVCEEGTPLPNFGDSESILLYARFFLHSISEQQQSSFLRKVESIVNSGGALALEFRTLLDADNYKVFSNHSRRFVDFDQLTRSLKKLGFPISYAIEGVGMAKFRQEDPVVGRILVGVEK